MPENPIEYTLVSDENMRIGQITVQDDDTLSTTTPNISIGTEHLISNATTATFFIVADTAPSNDLAVTLEFNYEAPNPAGSGTVDLFRYKSDGTSHWARTSVTIAAAEIDLVHLRKIANFHLLHRIPTPPFVVPVTGTLKVRLVDGDNYNLGTSSEAGVPTDEATPTNPLITISKIGDSRVVESTSELAISR